MTIKAIFLDFYGTIVHEDDDIIPLICQEIIESSNMEFDRGNIGAYWWQTFSRMVNESYLDTFETQRSLGLRSLIETIAHFKSSRIAEEIIQKQFSHWQRPGIFEDSKPFLDSLEIPVFILSNIDTHDVTKAIEYHCIKVNGIITSEDVRSYKPRSEMFNEAMRRFNISNKDVIHIGDSLTSDVLGAQRVGIRTVWMNRKHKKRTGDIQPDYTFGNLLELKTIL